MINKHVKVCLICFRQFMTKSSQVVWFSVVLKWWLENVNSMRDLFPIGTIVALMGVGGGSGS